MKRRQVCAYDFWKCGSCGKTIFPGTWYWQYFDEKGLFIKTSCPKCEKAGVKKS